MALEFEDLGSQTLKNIKKPIRVYRVTIESEGRDPKSKIRKPPFDKPFIAVLPFANMSADQEQEYFSDGITDDLITSLSKISGLVVIARNSSFKYKNKSIKAQQVANDLGVQYLLEGGVRKVGDHIRITAQLIDGATGGNLWAERYDRDLVNVFKLQDEVTQKIVMALAVKLTNKEESRLVHKYTDNIKAYDTFLRGLEYHFHFTQEGNIQARQLFEKAAGTDGRFALAYAYLSWTYLREWALGWSLSTECLEIALALGEKAINLDDLNHEAHCVLGTVYLWKKQHGRAIEELEKSISLSPSYADAIAELGDVLVFADKPNEAIELINKAMLLNPNYPVWYLWSLGHAYYSNTKFDEAVKTFKRVLDRNPNFWGAHPYLISCYFDSGRDDEARKLAVEMLRINPNYSLESSHQRLPYKNQRLQKTLHDQLKKAGIK